MKTNLLRIVLLATAASVTAVTAGCGGADEAAAPLTAQQQREVAAMHQAVQKAREANTARQRGERPPSTTQR